MRHHVSRCDFVDVLEDSVITGRNVAISLRGGQHFIDGVRHVLTQNGEDWAVFRDHDWIPVREIVECVRAEPREVTSDARL